MSSLDGSSKKRRRDQGSEEVKKRKAPKLSKAAEDLEENDAPDYTQPSHTYLDDVQPDEAIEGATPHIGGEFAHIKSTKKRHKLEKEARRARKAGKTVDHNPLNGVAQDKERDADQKTSEAQAPLIAVDGVNHGNQLARNGTASVGNSETPLPRKRRHKLEKVLEQPDPVAEEGTGQSDEERLKKHAGLMGKFQKSTQLSRTARDAADNAPDNETEQPEAAHELVIPRIDTDPKPRLLPADAAMPEWLAKPTVIHSSARAGFGTLGLDEVVAKQLSQLGLGEALPVQQVVVPLLLPPGVPGATYLPGSESVLPDIAVSAPTGSGKTIAYLLPIIESLKFRPLRGHINAVIIVPTRELVTQVAAVADSLAKGTHIRVGTASGSRKLAVEQEKLVKREERYGPETYTRLLAQAERFMRPPEADSEEMDTYLDELAQSDSKTEQRLQDALQCLPNHVPSYSSAVDILVTTPGRLAEHLSSTLGFNLTYLRWLVIDEADKILDNENEGFLDTLATEIRRPRTFDEQGARERLLRSRDAWDDRRERRVRKVVLSATMTRDITKLSSLGLSRPKLVVVRGSEGSGVSKSVVGEVGDELGSAVQDGDIFELPPTLTEYCVPVGDGNEKPLIAMELLFTTMVDSENMRKPRQGDTLVKKSVPAADDDSDDDSDTESSEESDSDSDSEQDSDSDPDSDDLSSDSTDDTSSVSSVSDDSSDEEDSASSDEESDVAAQKQPLKSSLTKSARKPRELGTTAPTILVFTSSNEAAHRLSHLLKSLKPEFASWINTLTKTKTAKGVNVQTKSHEPVIVVSTDRAARGLDHFGNRAITHVVQYDVPRSITGYVHRVGRTARAGRKGDAWTLYTNTEARWFTNEITKAATLRRAHAVERVKLFVNDEEMRKRYAVVLADMKQIVFGKA